MTETNTIADSSVCNREKGERSEMRTNFLLVSGIILMMQIIGGCILGALHYSVTPLWNEMTYANEFWFFGLLLGSGSADTSFLGRIKDRFSNIGNKL